MKKILVVVDMQNDFIDGSLGTEEAVRIVSSVVAEIERRKAENYEILLTADTHYGNYLSTAEGKLLPVVHCVKGTRGHNICDAVLRAAEGCKIYEKSSFGSPELIKDIVDKKPDEVEFIGLCTDVCVVSNAVSAKTFLPEAEIVVKGACCAGVTPEGHSAALRTMQSCQIRVI